MTAAEAGGPQRLPASRRPGADLVAELHRMDLAERIRLLDWLAEHRTGQLRTALREYRSTRPLRPVVPSGDRGPQARDQVSPAGGMNRS